MARPKGSKNKATVQKLKAQLAEGPKARKGKVDALAKLTDAQVVSAVIDRFNIMYKMGKGSVDGTVRGFIISGAPGVGKTHTIEWLLEQHAIKNPSFRFKVVKGAITAVNLFKILQEYRHPGNVVVLDDVDSIFFDDDGVALLKAALDSGTRRKMAWFSESSALKGGDGKKSYDTEFEYNGTMIFITNTDFQRYVTEGKNKLAPHFEALISRSIYLDLKLHGRRAVSLWVDHLVRKNNMLCERFNISAHEQNLALDFIKKNRDRLRTLSLREALKIGQFIATDRANWEVMANVILCTDGEL
jgi:hypothetical protein